MIAMNQATIDRLVPQRSATGNFSHTPSAPAPSVDLTFVETIETLGAYLAAQEYSFTTVTPATHQRLLRRTAGRMGHTLRDVFGWNLPFSQAALPSDLISSLNQAGLIAPQQGQQQQQQLWRSRIRFATIADRLYVHDAFPTITEDAVFFGPDTYRFVAAVKRLLRPCGLLADVGCGSGAGGLEISQRCAQVVLTDINPKALAFANANCRLAKNDHTLCLGGDLLDNLDQRPDAIIANPPYLVDPLQRTYRDGGGSYGIDLSLRIVKEAIHRLAPGGQLILYTGVPVIAGHDLFAQAALPIAQAADAIVDYAEIDPDVFGEELEDAAYGEVERIAAIVLYLTMP